MRPVSRTLPELAEHLEAKRRLAVADIENSKLRVEAIDRVLERVRTGRPINPCDVEEMDIDEWLAS